MAESSLRMRLKARRLRDPLVLAIPREIIIAVPVMAPEVLEQLRPRAKSFALTEGQTLSLTLEMTVTQ